MSLSPIPTTTELGWDDLVLPEGSMERVREIADWLQRARAASAPSARTVLFEGPSGTGKTLTAALLGARSGREVYRIDLSTVDSRFIGETEKNLARIFDRAERGDWILFFDEADALFGKRTDVRDAHDRYANTEVSHLLERVERHPGLVILATNLAGRLDEAVRERELSVIPFPVPDPPLRRRIWANLLRARGVDEGGLDLTGLAETYELTGRAIDDAVRGGAAYAAMAGRDRMSEVDLIAAVRDRLGR